jgi:Multicopper oxidase
LANELKAVGHLSRIRLPACEVDFVAANPGRTLFHCHQQLHMDFGFMRLFDNARAESASGQSEPRMRDSAPRGVLDRPRLPRRRVMRAFGRRL